jgi:hypothetical protein
MADADGAERLLRHPVSVTLPGRDPGVTVAASVAGDPPSTRIAWIDWAGAAIVARIACPPARPSRMRPVVATDVRVVQAGVDDRILAMRVADGARAVQVVVAAEEQPEPVAVAPDGVALARIDAGLLVLGVDALDGIGEPVGRLDAAGIGSLRLEGGRFTGRLGTGHGMAAGFGAGRVVASEDEAAFEAGYRPTLPGWLPEGLDRGAFRVEPDAAYPAAPPAVVVAWGTEPGRVLLRQTPGPLANPDPVQTRSSPVDIGDSVGMLMTRGRFATLVWEAADRAFGIQVSGIDDPGDVAVRVARSM